jgi:PAS domain S-box-containing protein
LSSRPFRTKLLHALAAILPATYSVPATPPSADPPAPDRAQPQPRPILRAGLLRLGLIFFAIVYATRLRAALEASYGVKPTFLTYFPAILALAALWGPAAGVWATVFSAFAVDFFFLADPGSLRIHHTADQIVFLVFIAAGLAVSFTAGSLRRLNLHRKLADDQLRSANESLAIERRTRTAAQLRLAAIVESTEDAIITKDINGIITSWNAGAEHIFGYTAAEAIGRSILTLIPPGREFEEDEIRSHILHNESIRNFDTLRVTRDGRTIHTSLTVSPIYDDAGNIVGASKIARDTTHIQSMERQLRHSQKMDAVGQLTGGIAHDFNNLLAIVIGSLELQAPLLQDNPAALVAGNRAHAAALRGADLTRRLLAFSSADQSNLAPIHLATSIRNILELARHTLGPEINLVLTLDDDLAPVVVDAGALENSVLNLILNARDAMPHGGTITVDAAQRTLDQDYARVLNPSMNAGLFACISVTDTGTGMTPEVRDRAFEPFFTTKERGRGTGLASPPSTASPASPKAESTSTASSSMEPPSPSTFPLTPPPPSPKPPTPSSASLPSKTAPSCSSTTKPTSWTSPPPISAPSATPSSPPPAPPAPLKSSASTPTSPSSSPTSSSAAAWTAPSSASPSPNSIPPSASSTPPASPPTPSPAAASPSPKASSCKSPTASSSSQKSSAAPPSPPENPPSAAAFLHRPHASKVVPCPSPTTPCTSP